MSIWRWLFGPPAPRRPRYPKKVPDSRLLLDPPITESWGAGDERGTIRDALCATLAAFKIDGTLLDEEVGPLITVYPFVPLPGTKVAKIVNLAPEIALALRVPHVHIAALPIVGALGLSIPNPK